LTKNLAAVAFLVPDYDDAIARIRGARGEHCLESPRRESHGVVAVFADPWDPLQSAKRRARPTS
jgi:hypothetical protein